MPRPVSSKRNSSTMVANPSNSLADALGMGRPDLQEAAREQQAANCVAAATPSTNGDADSEGGLSEDDEPEDTSSVLRRDILHDRHQAFQSVVAPASCTTAAFVAPNTGSSSSRTRDVTADRREDDDNSDDDDQRSIPTRPASVVDHSLLLPQKEEGGSISSSCVPSVPSHYTGEGAPEPFSTPTEKKKDNLVDFGGYNEDDWDRPLGQTNYWYDDTFYYNDMRFAEITGSEPHPHSYVTSGRPSAFVGAPLPEDEIEPIMTTAAPSPTWVAPKPRRVRRVPSSSSGGVYGQITFEPVSSSSSSSSEVSDTEEEPYDPEPEVRYQNDGDFRQQRQDTEPFYHSSHAPSQRDDSQQYQEYRQRLAAEQQYDYQEQQAEAREEEHHHVTEEVTEEEKEDNYNPECPCGECMEIFMNRQRSDINMRWGKRFPKTPSSSPQSRNEGQRSMVVAPRSQQQQQGGVSPQNFGPVVNTAFSTSSSLYTEAGQPKHPRGSKGGNPFAVVACCYFKQKGFCKMGPDCWYSHDADASTPCHYGALCKAAGHKHLAKNSSTVPPVAGGPPHQGYSHHHGLNATSALTHAPFLAHPTLSSMSPTVVPRVRATVPATKPVAAAFNVHERHHHRQAPRPTTAILVPSIAPCAFCGAGPDSVMTQEFPVYQGTVRTSGQRAHCTECLRTYAL